MGRGLWNKKESKWVWGESGKWGKLKQGCRGVKWNENREEERRVLWEDAARGVIKQD